LTFDCTTLSSIYCNVYSHLRGQAQLLLDIKKRCLLSLLIQFSRCNECQTLKTK